MKKKAMSATLLCAITAAHAGPAVMVGISHNFGGATGVTFKVLSTERKNKPVLAAGVSYFPGQTEGQRWGADMGIGYTFNHGAITLGYDWLNEQAQLGLGWAKTRSAPNPAPAPAPVVEAAVEPAPAPKPAPAPAPKPKPPAPAPTPAPPPAPAPAPTAALDDGPK